ncbi:MAG: REP-associated tyrosine transposase [Moraxellaceae bacterium]
MPNYRRSTAVGTSYFFTVNLLERQSNDLLIREIDLLRKTVKRVNELHPFQIDAWVVLPEHMHAVWTLPPGDCNYSQRWRLIRSLFSRALPLMETRNRVRVARGERGIWQRRFWEHQIRNDMDFAKHVDYVHINPVKHGLVARAADWPYSSIHRYIRQGIYAPDWAASPDIEMMSSGER